MSENLNQSVIDDILASATHDTPESRLDRLEEEVNVIKGSIKKLLLDIRETMNILENPFQSLQNLAENQFIGSSQPTQKIQIIPPEDKVEVEQESKEDLENNDNDVNIIDNNIPQQSIPDKLVSRFDNLDDKLLDIGKMAVPKSGKMMDPHILFEVMEWSKSMLTKYGAETLRDLLEIFEMLGYIDNEVREVVDKIVSLRSREGFLDLLDDAPIDLYKLYNILNPVDNTLDSKVLKIILNKED